MWTAIASSNPHGMTLQSTDLDWSESDPLPAMAEKAENRAEMSSGGGWERSEVARV